MINNAMSVASAHKLRFAQDLILYNLELSEEVEGFDGSAHKEAWNNDPVWQATRENVERLTAIRDWAEAFFATTIVFEPLVGELFRSEFVMQVAAPQGDFVTPTLMGAGESDTARDRGSPGAVLDALRRREVQRREPRHDAGVARHVDPISLAAARALQPIWSQPGEKVVRFADSLNTPSGASTTSSPSSTSRPKGTRLMSMPIALQVNRTSSNRAGVTLMNNQVGYVVANVMRGVRASRSRSCRR